jgi:hypothetical protein
VDWLDIGSRVLGPAAAIIGGAVGWYVHKMLAPLRERLAKIDGRVETLENEIERLRGHAEKLYEKTELLGRSVDWLKGARGE